MVRTIVLAAGGLVAVVASIVLVTMWVFAWGVFGENVSARYAKATLRPRITQTINQPDNALATYERFRQECRDIVAKNEQIQNLRERQAQLLADARGDDPLGEKQRAANDALNDLTGAENLRAQEAADYNAQSATFSRSVFKSLGGNDPPLPDRIEAPYSNVDCG